MNRKLNYLLIIILIIGFGDMVLHSMRLMHISHEKKKKIIQLQQIQPIKKVTFKELSKKDMLSMVFQQLNDSGLKVNTISLPTNIQHHLLKISLSLTGDFPQIINFILALEQKHLIAFFSKFYLTLDKNREIHFNVELTILDILDNLVAKKTKKIWHDAFLERENVISYQIQNHLSLFSLEQFKWVGYLQSSSSIEAVFTSPDNEINILQVGDLVGREKAQVVSINNHKIVLEKLGHEITLIYK